MARFLKLGPGLLALACLLMFGAAPVGKAVAQAPAATVNVATNATLGQILVDSAGMTLYMRTTDMPDTSTCTGACLTVWPPLQPPAYGTPTLAPGIPGALTTFNRADGGVQVEYDSMPLYHFNKDMMPGDANGQGMGNFLAATPAAAAASAAPAAATVQTVNNQTLGPILVDSAGMTLYMRTIDAPGTSSCTGGCVGVWPPLQPPAGGSPTLAAGINGTLNTFTRADGTMQVQYQGMPLYYYSGDKNPGDTNGQGIGGTWFAAVPQ